MKKLEIITLQNLLKRGYALEQRTFLNEFPDNKRNDVLAAIANLQSLGYVMQDYSESGITITLVESRKGDALREASSIYLPDPSQTPIEDIIPKNTQSHSISQMGSIWLTMQYQNTFLSHLRKMKKISHVL